MNEETLKTETFETQKIGFRRMIESRQDSVMLHALVHDLMEENKQLREKLAARIQQ